MNGTELIALLPLIVMAIAAVVLMLVIAFYRHHRLALRVTLGGLAISFATLPLAALVIPLQVTPLLMLDTYALFFMGLILAAGFIITVQSHGYLKGREGRPEELYLLLLLATLGGMVLVASTHFAAFFLGLELLSISLFALIAYPVHSRRALEAGIKYLVLASTSSAFLLFGMALIYAELGTLSFPAMSTLLPAGASTYSPYMLAGVAMLMVGVGFKLSLVPFHLWTPDVYEGAPTPVTAFLATVSKGALFALLLRYFIEVDIYRYDSLVQALSLLAMASMLAGNLLALLQTNIKRILAYSSIAHLGYLLVALLASGPRAIEAVSYYLVAYFITTLGAFGAIILWSIAQGRDADTVEDYRGLFWQQPWMAGFFTAMLLSLAGIPLTAGFVAKFYVLAAGVEATLWVLVITLITGSAIGLFYYLRIIVTLFTPLPEHAERIYLPSTSLASGVVLAVLTVALVWLGIYPAPLIDLIQTMAANL